MRDFTIEDLSGAGQYLVRMDANQIHEVENDRKPFVKDTGYLSTIMFKVGYLTNNLMIGGTYNQVSVLIAMSDGWTRVHHYSNTKDEEGKDTPSETWVKHIWSDTADAGISGKQKLVDHLNNGTQEFRFATQEEVVRVVMYQSSRWRN